MAINFILFRKTISQNRLLAVLATCVGVALCSVTEFRSNLFGTVIACAAFSVTACYQIWIGKKMADLEVDAPQLLLNQSANAIWLLIPVSVAFDTMPDLCEFFVSDAWKVVRYLTLTDLLSTALIPTPALISLVAGGVVASLINLSQFLIIGRTSALTVSSPQLLYPAMISRLTQYSSLISCLASSSSALSRWDGTWKGRSSHHMMFSA